MKKLLLFFLLAPALMRAAAMQPGLTFIIGNDQGEDKILLVEKQGQWTTPDAIVVGALDHTKLFTTFYNILHQAKMNSIQIAPDASITLNRVLPFVRGYEVYQALEKINLVPQNITVIPRYIQNAAWASVRELYLNGTFTKTKKDQTKEIINAIDQNLLHQLKTSPGVNQLIITPALYQQQSQQQPAMQDSVLIGATPLTVWGPGYSNTIYFYDAQTPLKAVGQNNYYEFTNFWPVAGGINYDSTFNIQLPPFGKNSPVISWPTTEHYYQAQKTTDEKIQKTIASFKTPREAFDYFRNNPKLVRPDWKSISIPVMLTALRAKFAPNTDLAKLLVGTWPNILVEDAGKNDAFYGAGADYKGENILGRLLMHVRAERMGKIPQGSAYPYTGTITTAMPSKPTGPSQADTLLQELRMLNTELDNLENALKLFQ
ncbi:MAG: NADAR family protein [Candidatus Babeliales bacterium]